MPRRSRPETGEEAGPGAGTALPGVLEKASMAPQLERERVVLPLPVVDDSGERMTVSDPPLGAGFPTPEPSAEAIDVDDFIIRTGPSTAKPAVAAPADAPAEPLALEPARPAAMPPPSVPDGLPREDALRTRALSGAVAVACGAGAVVQLWLGSSLAAAAVLTSLLLAAGAVSVWTWRVTAEPSMYTGRHARAFAGAAALAALLLPYALGVFSPAPVIVVLGITSFALGSDRVTAIGAPVLVSVGYAILGGLVAAGALPDLGVLGPAGLSARVEAMITVAVPASYLLALWQARLSRRATVEAIERSNDAVREAARATALREKQLERVNRDLDRLLSLGAGEPGAYTGEECGRYLLGKLVGRGAMAEVYAASDPKSGATAAVKLLQPNLAPDANLVLRFLREGEASSKLHAPNVVTIYEVGKTRDGAPYIAMELLRGHDLGWHLRQRIRIPLEEALGIVEQVALGLEVARRAGVVHRDLKPQNIFLAQQERAAPVWKILDFGVSRIVGSHGTLTQDMVVGTPAYMSPEQAAGTETTHRSDVFSFGAMTYRALTGELPFDAVDTPQVLYKVVYKNPPRPSEVCTALPPDVDLVLAIALAKDKEDRFGSALEFAAALRDAAHGRLHRSLRLHGTTVLAALPWDRAVRQSETSD